MSTFSGITREYPEVAIDYFSGKQILKARAYFLSHVHTGKRIDCYSHLGFRDLNQVQYLNDEGE